MGWCRGNSLILDVAETNAIIVDFRKNQPSYALLLINNTAVRVVSSKFLGGAHHRQAQLVCKHCGTSQEGIAAHVLPVQGEESHLEECEESREDSRENHRYMSSLHTGHCTERLLIAS